MKKLISRAGRRSLVTLGLAAIVAWLIFEVVQFNRDMPSSREYELANAIVANLRKDVVITPDAQVYFETANARVTINVYGVLDKELQEKLAKGISKIVANKLSNEKEISVDINFFEKRTVLESKLPNGSVMSEVVKVQPKRSIRLP